MIKMIKKDNYKIKKESVRNKTPVLKRVMIRYLIEMVRLNQKQLLPGHTGRKLLGK